MKQVQLDLDGNNIAVYESGGSGPAILLIHGNSANAQTFKHQLGDDFGKTHRVVAFDLPGHGNSPAATNPETTNTLGGYATIVIELITRLQLIKPVVVGWSLGGHIALEAVDSLPNVAGFFIYGTPPIGIPPAMEQAFLPNPVMATAFASTFSEEQASALASAFLKPGAMIPPSFRKAILNTDGKARALLGASIGAANYKDEVQVVAKMTMPLAIIHGAADQLINVNYIRNLMIPTLWRGEIQIIENAGHAIHWEQPNRFNAMLAKFVADVR